MLFIPFSSIAALALAEDTISLSFLEKDNGDRRSVSIRNLAGEAHNVHKAIAKDPNFISFIVNIIFLNGHSTSINAETAQMAGSALKQRLSHLSGENHDAYMVEIREAAQKEDLSILGNVLGHEELAELAMRLACDEPFVTAFKDNNMGNGIEPMGVAIQGAIQGAEQWMIDDLCKLGDFNAA